jgi:hypothetical protein
MKMSTANAASDHAYRSLSCRFNRVRYACVSEFSCWYVPVAGCAADTVVARMSHGSICDISCVVSELVFVRLKPWIDKDLTQKPPAKECSWMWLAFSTLQQRLPVQKNDKGEVVLEVCLVCRGRKGKR